MKKGITHAPRFFVKNDIFSYLTLKLTFLTLKTTLNNQSTFRNRFPSQTRMKIGLVHLFLGHLLKYHILIDL